MGIALKMNVNAFLVFKIISFEGGHIPARGLLNERPNEQTRIEMCHAVDFLAKFHQMFTERSDNSDLFA